MIPRKTKKIANQRQIQTWNQRKEEQGERMDQKKAKPRRMQRFRILRRKPNEKRKQVRNSETKKRTPRWLSWKKNGFMKMTFLPSLAAPIVFGTFWKIHSSIDSSAENTPFLLNMQLFLIALILSALTRTFASSCAKMVYRTTMKTSFLSSNALICYAG